jgi:CDP-2,3-bis-(O-geranylgeranyl)-sn-glycerol synthase
MTGTLDPSACAGFLILSFTLAGCAQATWLSSAMSRRLAWPLDAGLTFRGRRLFGPNKTVRGCAVMVPATGVAFVVVATVTSTSGRWTLSLAAYCALGLLAGIGFMAAELPNSFLKRQLDIPAGAAARGSLTHPLFFALDHLDSTCGVLVAVALAVRVPAWTMVYVLAIGWVVHAAFSVLTFRLGGKARAA